MTPGPWGPRPLPPDPPRWVIVGGVAIVLASAILGGLLCHALDGVSLVVR